MYIFSFSGLDLVLIFGIIFCTSLRIFCFWNNISLSGYFDCNGMPSLPKALVSTAEAVLSTKKLLVKFKNQIFVIPICIHTVLSVKSSTFYNKLVQ